MAIVREFDCANGAHVIVRDDCYRDCTPEEIARRWEDVRQALAFAALRAAQLAAQQGKEGESA